MTTTIMALLALGISIAALWLSARAERRLDDCERMAREIKDAGPIKLSSNTEQWLGGLMGRKETDD